MSDDTDQEWLDQVANDPQFDPPAINLEPQPFDGPIPVLGHEVPLYCTAGLSRDEWLRRRREGRTVGASAIAGVLQIHPYSSPLQVWAEVTGRYQKQFDPEELDRMLIGTACEPEIRLVAASRLGVGLCSWETGRELVHRRISFLSPWPVVCQHPTIPQLTANLDAVAFVNGELSVVELKWGGWRQRDAWADYQLHQTLDAVVGTSVLAYYTQVQAQLAVTGLRTGYLVGVLGEEAAAWMLANVAMMRRERSDARPLKLREGDVFCFKIERDEAAIECIEEVVPRFYQRFVATGTMPPATDKRDLEVLSELYLCSNPTARPRVDALEDDVVRFRDLGTELGRLGRERDTIKARLLGELTTRGVQELVAGAHELRYRANVHGTRSLTTHKA